MTHQRKDALRCAYRYSTMVGTFVGLMVCGAVSAQTYSKTETIEYHDDLSNWVLGQVRRTTTNGIETSRTEFNAKAQPVTTYAFGLKQQSLTYNADGTVATVRDGNNNATTLAGWKRGIPQSITYADGSKQSAVVDDNGWIRSVTNEVQARTCYDYDAMGRLAKTTYPSESATNTCDASSWNVTYQSFEKGTTPVGGLPAGHWRQTVSTGNARKVTYFDALWRPVITETYDAGNVTNTLTQTVTRYDSEGRPVFQSYPQRTTDAAITNTWGNPAVAVHASTKGTYTAYDALGRTTSVVQDSELASPNNLLVTLYDYLPGFKTRVTNPRGVQTFIEYQTFDQPTTDAPTSVTVLGGVAGQDIQVTEIGRDVFGKPRRISKRDGNNSIRVDRHYVYDWTQRLCKSVEPETAATVYFYDGANNLTYSMAGMNLPDPNDCNIQGGRPSIARTYDARNRLTTLRFPDGLGNQQWTYTADGLPQSITTANDGTSQALNSYAYNKRRLLTGESASQPGWYNWSVGYGYDGNGALSAQTYPTGLVVNFFPDALGRPTFVRDTYGNVYASGFQYHPNGAIKQFMYGNNVVHTMTQNVRQLPTRTTETAGVMDYDIRYDANGNVTDIYDYTNGGNYNRHMSYDGLDRLLSAASWAFGGDGWHRFTYNALDNLTSWKLAGVKDYASYLYDQNNRLTGIRNSAGSTIVGLSYDVQGNLYNKNGQRHVFDYGNRLREMPGKEHYRYDGHGRRILAWNPVSGKNILSLYGNNGQLLYEYDERIAKEREHIYLQGSLLATREKPFAGGATTISYQHTDALGSPVAVSNHSTVLKRNFYEPYGAVVGQPGYGGIGYTGHVQDALTGLTYMQQRYYDPQLGRFLSVDPVTAYSMPGGNFNRYWYANNNPYRFADPDGRLPCDVCDEIASQGARWLARTIMKASENFVQSGVDAFNKGIQDAKNHIQQRDIIVSAGLSGLIGAPSIGNSITSPGVTVVGDAGVVVNLTSGQVGVQGNIGPTTSFGGGAAGGVNLSIGLNKGPLQTGTSINNVAFAQITAVTASGTPVNAGGAVQWSDGGANVSTGLKYGVGSYIGLGAGKVFSGTWATKPYFREDDVLDDFKP